VFKRYPTKGYDDFHEKNSFSLESNTRTLDVEAPSEIEKLLFLDKLKILLQHQAHLDRKSSKSPNRGAS
jgi:hypothetical protein